jgi:hypothetical protein
MAIDPVKRDGKKLSFSGPSVILHFVFSVCILIPLWIILLIPAAIISLIVGKFLKSKKRESSSVEGSKSQVFEEHKRQPPGSPRDFDLILYGATGFTGKLAAEYLAKNYGTKFKWAIAGRRNDALVAIRNDLIKIDSKLKDLPIVIADSSDEVSIDKMTNSTKVVITTAGNALMLK